MNTEKIAAYIRSGAKSAENIGIEIEHFIVDKNNSSVSYYGECGVGKILTELSEAFDNRSYSEGQLIGLSNGRWHLTLEPAAQLEISIEPCEYIDEIESCYNDFLEMINPVLDKYGYRLLCIGYQPSDKVDELDLIPKRRYELMDRYFADTGIYGRNMMRGTASTQVSIDFTDEVDCIKKFRLANILVPLLALITDNSPIFEGKPYNGRMIRTTIWNSVDNARCGIVPGGADVYFSFKKYAEYIMNVPPIFIERDGASVYTVSKRLKEIYDDHEMTESEIEHALSMVFPDVRLKQYIEIRPADSMPINYALSYAAFVKGIFNSLDAVYRYLNVDEITDSDVMYAKEELIAHGFNACVYNKRASDIYEFLFMSALTSLSSRDRCYLSEIKELIFSKQTPKEVLDII